MFWNNVKNFSNAQIHALRSDPKKYIKNLLYLLKEIIGKKISEFFQPKNIWDLTLGLLTKLIGTAIIAGLVFLAVQFSFPEMVENVLYSLQPANQKDIRTMHRLLDGYRDYVEQSNRAFGRVASKEQELFFDVVKSVFPVKIESGLISLTDSEQAALNNRATVRKRANFSQAFGKTPFFYAIPKNLDFGGQKERSTELVVRCACDTGQCDLSINLDFNNLPQRALLRSKPQVHWIAAGLFPSDTIVSGTAEDRQFPDDQFSKETCLQRDHTNR